MISFQPDICLPKDPSGWGQWLTGHYREHIQMAQICLLLSPPISVPPYDIFQWSDDPDAVQRWLVAHEEIHEVLRFATNTQGVDLSLIDFSDENQFLIWLDNHSLEHQNFRTVLGIT